MTIIKGKFEWDSAKNEANKKKHGIAFEEILAVFDDPYFWESYDYGHSDNENRLYGLGCINGLLVILTCFTERGERIRIISARRADKELEEVYHDNIKKLNG